VAIDSAIPIRPQPTPFHATTHATPPISQVALRRDHRCNDDPWSSIAGGRSELLITRRTYSFTSAFYQRFR